jgi:poly(3-hydroxybutyrate) depolymerase
MCKSSLSLKDANNITDKLYSAWIEQHKDSNKIAWTQKEIANDNLRMKFDYKIYGDTPSDGRSLYISLHGGGNTPAEVNDQQWKNQISLYKPQEGLYIAPRAPWNDWNMWFKPGIDQLFDELIHLSIAMENVNPDKVYLLGYSAGGDGLYRMASRMADRWAAASMMAGHPGEALQVNLRNLPFMIWMGENDAAYDRNKWAEK